MTTAAPKTSNQQKLIEYLGSNQIFIVDTSSASRRRLSKTLSDLGAKQQHIHLHSQFEIAQAEIRRLKPRIIITDFMLGARSGLELLQTQREEFPDSRDCLFALITANADQSTIAKAAEEDVDIFVIKPYTMKQLVTTLIVAMVDKMNPNEYRRTIDAGRKLLLQGNPDEAIPIFEHAMTLDSSPSMACAYLGQARAMKNALKEAKSIYEKGLGYNRIHYRCLVGLHDIFMKQGLNQEAYSVVRQIASIFPANPKRLASVIRLAVVTKNYVDMEGYYSIFKNLEDRDPELVRYICAGLIVAGKFFAGQGQRDKASSHLENASISCGGHGPTLRQVIETALETDFVELAQATLKRFSTTTENDYLIAKFLVSDRTGTATQSIDAARNLTKAGVQWPTCTAAFIRRLLEVGNIPEAEFILETAQAQWKDQTRTFDPIVMQLQEAKLKKLSR